MATQALEPNSLAARSGKLCVGDLLHAVNEQPVSTHEEATLALRAAEGEIALKVSSRIRIDALSTTRAEPEAAKAAVAEAEQAAEELAVEAEAVEVEKAAATPVAVPVEAAEAEAPAEAGAAAEAS